MSLIDDFISSFILILNSSEVWFIAALSFFVSFSAVTLSSIIGIPIGVIIGLRRGKTRLIPISLLNTGMALPPVLVGLLVYLMFFRQSLLGSLEILFTPLAMILAQMILTFPIIVGITRSTIKELSEELPEMLISMGATKIQSLKIIINEGRSGMTIAIIVALGRAFSEVGAILIVGGNIRYRTRVLTTAVVLEISKGNRPMALALGMLLIIISFSLTTIITSLQLKS